MGISPFHFPNFFRELGMPLTTILTFVLLARGVSMDIVNTDPDGDNVQYPIQHFKGTGTYTYGPRECQGIAHTCPSESPCQALDSICVRMVCVEENDMEYCTCPEGTFTTKSRCAGEYTENYTVALVAATVVAIGMLFVFVTPTMAGATSAHQTRPFLLLPCLSTIFCDVLVGLHYGYITVCCDHRWYYILYINWFVCLFSIGMLLPSHVRCHALVMGLFIGAVEMTAAVICAHDQRWGAFALSVGCVIATVAFLWTCAPTVTENGVSRQLFCFPGILWAVYEFMWIMTFGTHIWCISTIYTALIVVQALLVLYILYATLVSCIPTNEGTCATEISLTDRSML
jgi:hypothetical protein